MSFNPLLATFSFLIFMFGVMMIYLTIDQHSKISNLCVSSKVQIGFNIILMLSIMMTIVPLIQLYCHWGCGHPQNDLSYKWIIVVICILLVGSASTVLNGIDNETNCKLSSARNYMIGLISTGVILFVILIFGPFLPFTRDSLGDFGSSNDTSLESEL